MVVVVVVVYLTANGQSTSSSWYLIFVLSLVTITLLFFLQGALSDERSGLQLAVQSVTGQATEDHNHTLPSHLKLYSLFVASYDSQGLRWSILTNLHTG
jgi:hypothetical protein